MLVRVMGTVLDMPAEAELQFYAGIDDLEHLSRDVGQRFSLEVEVVERDGDRVVLVPIGAPPLEDE
jgi:hypothetical protein